MESPLQEPQNPTLATPTAEAEPPMEDRQVDPALKAIAAWINQLSRTIKTCRLYHATNPTVVRFRAELVDALARLTAEQGPITYRFTADDILHGDHSLHPAKSRDDNLALAFHRDGVRSITFGPGVTQRELDALVDALMLVTGQVHIEDDLVTLLWQANLQHVDVDVVPGEGDVGTGTAEETGELLPWPTIVPGVEEAATSSPTAPEPDAMSPEVGSRSDDWTTGDSTVEVEAGFEELDELAPSEIARFHEEFAAEHEVSLMTTALAVAHAYLDAGSTSEDRLELARFLPRMLRLAIGEGSWLEAREALMLLRDCDSEEWSPESFTQELFQPISVTATVELLDRQRSGQVAEFVALAKELGEQAPEWLNLVLAASQNQTTRRILAESVAALCRDNPERIAPWLADPNWFVVRNAVQILGSIGGEAVLEMLSAAAHHADRRVRYEVVGALASMPPDHARPLLLEMLPQADSRQFCAILHQLASERHTPTAVLLVGFLQTADFEQRPDVEKRAIYSAIAAVGTDDILLELEAELAKGNWLMSGADTHRQAIARCVARIGTARAHALLERGAESKRAGVRTVCTDALRMLRVRD
jgi:HEAT repeat protein